MPSQAENQGADFQSAAAEHRQKLAQQGHVANPHLERMYRAPKVEMPLHPNDEGMRPQIGIPEDWDYKTAQQGPFGEELPNGAVGWKPDGTAWYGTNSNFTEWIKGFKNNLLGEAKQTSRQYLKDALYDVLGQNKEKGFIGSQLSAVQNVGQAIGNVGLDEGDSPTGLALASRLVGQGIVGLGTGLSEAAEQVESAIGMTDGVLDSLSEKSSLPDYQGQYKELSREEISALPDGFLENAAYFLNEALNVLDTTDLIWRGVQSVEALATGKATLSPEDIKAEYAAGKIAYSNWLNPALKEEYKRRFLAGENPYLLEQELQNPVAELAGQLIFDPLNVIGFLGKGDDAAKAAKTMQTLLTSPADEIGRVVSKWDEFSDISKLDDLVKGTQKFINRIRGGLTAAAKDTGLSALTSSGKAAHVDNITGQFMGWVVSSLRRADGTFNLDEAMEVMRSVYLMSSSKADEVAEAVAILGKYHEKGLPLGVLFSDGAGQTSVVLRSIMESSGGWDELVKLVKKAGTPEELLDIIKPAKEAATKSLFPTLKQRAAKETLSLGEQALMHMEGIANSKALRGINNAFAHVYMGMSPGYVVRNALTNFTHLFVDEGAGVFKHGIINQIFSPGSADNYIKGVYGHVIDAAKSGIGSAAETAGEGIIGKITGQGLKWGQKAEIAASKQIVAATTRRMLKKMLRPGLAIPDIGPLLDEGMDLATASHLQNLLVQTNGNVKAAEKIFRSEIMTGGHDLFRAMGWIDPTDAAKLDDLNLMDKVKEIVQGATSKEDASAKFAQFFDNLIDEAADAASREISSYPLGGEHQSVLTALKESGQFSDEMLATIQDQMASNKIADGAYRDAVTQIKIWAKNNGIDIQQVADSDPLLRMVMDGTYWDAKTAQNTKLVDPVTWWSRQIKGNKVDDLARAWREIGLSGEPPKGLTKQQLLDELWDGYFKPKSRDFWKGTREEHAQLVERLFQTVTGGATDDFRFMDKAREALENARLFDNAGYMNGQRVKNPSQFKIKHYQKTYGIKSDDHLLNLVNKYLRGEYGDEIVEGAQQFTKADLANMNPDTVRDALRARLLSGEGDIPDGLVFRGEGPSSTGGGWYTPDISAAQEYADDYGDAGKIVDRLIGKDEKIATQNDILRIARQFDPVGDVENAGYHLLTPETYEHADDIIEALKAEGFSGAKIDFGGDFSPSGKAIESYYFFSDITPTADDLLKAPMPSEKPYSYAYGMSNQTDELTRLRNLLVNGVDENWGLRQAATEGAEGALSEWFTEATRRTNTMRHVTEQTATAARNFALLDYSERKNFDTILGLIYPYQFWYSRTYPNWIRRIAKNPQLLAHYAKYRRTLEQLHAGMPDWWKYNINTNELFGLDSENPMFFNLEATLNPLNGVTGIDFDDKYKKVGFFSTMLADMNRFGPSTHTALSWAMGLGLYFQGEEEAARRWMGGVGQFTSAATALKSLLGGGGESLDPITRIFSGKVDPYTERRVNRALYAMAEEGLITAEEALDAARLKEGDIWQTALDRAVRERAPGTLMSYAFGVGFKPRTLADMEVDQAYTEYFGIMNNRQNLSPAEFRQAINGFFMKYPQMDTVLVGMKNNETRDAAYAWSILGRIPPGASYDFYRAVGLDERVVEKWYDSKGSFDGWSESDKNRFMAAIVDIGAVLAIPDQTTKADWTMAQIAHSEMKSTMRKFFGDEIEELMDAYWEVKNSEGDDAASAYLKQNPVVGLAFDYEAGVLSKDPIGHLAAYYSGVQKIESYYKGLMYNEAEQKFGSNIFDLNSMYWSLPTKERKQFLNQNPQLKQYWQFKDAKQQIINERVVEVGSLLREGMPALLRENFGEGGIGMEDIAGVETRDPLLQYSPTQWQYIIGDEGYQLALKGLTGSLTRSEENRLSYYAGVVSPDMDIDRLIQYVGIAQNRQTNSVQNPLQP